MCRCRSARPRRPRPSAAEGGGQAPGAAERRAVARGRASPPRSRGSSCASRRSAACRSSARSTARRTTRQALGAKIKAKVVEDVPADVIAAEGETLVALELVPADYDFLEGILQAGRGPDCRLLRARGPDDVPGRRSRARPRRKRRSPTSSSTRSRTRASTSTTPQIRSSGESDRISAAHALIEGDATCAMLDASGVAQRRHRRLDDGEADARGRRRSPSGKETPHVLKASLVAPYVGRLRVRAAAASAGRLARRRRGVRPHARDDRAAPPRGQVRRARAGVGAAAQIDPAALGPGSRRASTTIMGEQGLRIMLRRVVEPGRGGCRGERLGRRPGAARREEGRRQEHLRDRVSPSLRRAEARRAR